MGLKPNHGLQPAAGISWTNVLEEWFFSFHSIIFKCLKNAWREPDFQKNSSTNPVKIKTLMCLQIRISKLGTQNH